MISLFGRRFNDEPDRPGSFVIEGYEFLGKIWPMADEYRIIVYDLRTTNRYGLQANIDGFFVDVLSYHDGIDDYGKFQSGKWVEIANRCNWSFNQISLLRIKMLGEDEPISEASAPMDLRLWNW